MLHRAIHIFFWLLTSLYFNVACIVQKTSFPFYLFVGLFLSFSLYVFLSFFMCIVVLFEKRFQFVHVSSFSASFPILFFMKCKDHRSGSENINTQYIFICAWIQNRTLSRMTKTHESIEANRKGEREMLTLCWIKSRNLQKKKNYMFWTATTTKKNIKSMQKHTRNFIW